MGVRSEPLNIHAYEINGVKIFSILLLSHIINVLTLLHNKITFISSIIYPFEFSQEFLEYLLLRLSNVFLLAYFLIILRKLELKFHKIYFTEMNRKTFSTCFQLFSCKNQPIVSARI